MFSEFIPFSVGRGDGDRQPVGGLNEGDNRIVTALGYLRTVPEGRGGTTHFPTLDLHIKPVVGRLAIWDNIEYESGLRIADSVHQAMPLLRRGGHSTSEAEGARANTEHLQKWVFNLWFRGGRGSAGGGGGDEL
jgi:hypothetical protein